MFKDCISLKYIDVSRFDTSNVNDMRLMFSGCRSLEKINISNFIINDKTQINYMFSKCANELKDIIKKQNIKIKESAFKIQTWFDKWIDEIINIKNLYSLNI